MKTTPRLEVSLAIVFVLFIIAAGVTSGADNSDKEIHPTVIRTQSDGGKYYQRIVFGNASFDFFERPNEIRSTSQLVDVDLYKNKQNLTHFRLVLRQEPAKYVPAPKDRQAAAYPATKWTIYDDLNGDSVLDTMVKIGPNLHETYILLNNSWIRVGNVKAKWSSIKKIGSVDGKHEYAFERDKWVLVK